MLRAVRFLALLLLPAVHPLHTTHTDVRQRGDGVEITIRAFTDDLLRAVTAREHAGDDSALVRYVRATLTLSDRSGRPAPLTLVGHRLDGDVTLVTLRAVLPGGFPGVQLRQAMHLELFEDQVNVVRVDYGSRQVSLLFTPGDGARTLP